MGDPSTSLIAVVDKLVVSGQRVFGWGWAAHPRHRVASVHLCADSAEGASRIVAGYGLSRPDVEALHPTLAGAGASGFLVTGYLKEAAPARLRLEVALENGDTSVVEVCNKLERLDSKQKRRRLGTWLLGALWRRIKLGDLTGIVRRARAQHYAAPSLEDREVAAELVAALEKCSGLCVVFDHNMGGGANQYRRALIADRLKRGQAVLLCTYNLPVLGYRMHLFRPGAEERVFAAGSFLAVERVLDQGHVAELFVNSPVSFDEPLMLAEWLSRMRAAFPAIHLTVTIHDYFSVCPSFVLLDARGAYCGVPDVSSCDKCLASHGGSYVALSPPTPMRSWRASWGRCLQSADEVRCFSSASRSILLRAYPALQPDKVTVVPHIVEFTPQRLPRYDNNAPLVIGVMGEISAQKGAGVIQDLVGLLDACESEARVVVIGTLDVACRSPRLKVTGPYRREALAELIEEHGVNVLFFPSIWPETFSYVVAEMRILGLPIVAFDLGAASERLQGYAASRLCKTVSAEAALEALVALHAEAGARRRAVA